MAGFSVTGGIRVGRSYWLAWNATVPFATLSATDKELKLSGLGKTYSFLKSDNFRLSQYVGILARGLQIEHSDPTYPKFLVFWTFHLAEVRRSLEELGYQVN